MPYLIDGHNLIGKLPGISLDDPDDEAKLVERLRGFVARTRQKCVVVFDHGVPGGVSRMSNNSVQVVFASAHEDADTVLKRRIRSQSNPQAWTVVSSDNDVLFTAQSLKMRVMKSAAFAREMERPAQQAAPDPSEAAQVRVSEDEVAELLDLFLRKRKDGHSR